MRKKNKRVLSIVAVIAISLVLIGIGIISLNYKQIECGISNRCGLVPACWSMCSFSGCNYTKDSFTMFHTKILPAGVCQIEFVQRYKIQNETTMCTATEGKTYPSGEIATVCDCQVICRTF